MRRLKRVAVAVLTVGGVLIVGWVMLRPADGPGKTAPTFTSTGNKRVGRAVAAPLLQVCGRYVGAGLGAEEDIAPGARYFLMQRSASAIRIATLASSSEQIVDASLIVAVMWGRIADCVYRQNGRAFCDPDNRALAVEVADHFVRQATLFGTERLAKARAVLNSETLNGAEVAAMKERVLDALRTRLREGRLVAGDFGFFPSGEIRRLLREMKRQRNACAAEGVGG